MINRKCERINCTTHNCNRYSTRYGFICNLCFDELCKGNIYISITDFLQTPKQPEPKASQEAIDKFDMIYPRRAITEIDVLTGTQS